MSLPRASIVLFLVLSALTSGAAPKKPSAAPPADRAPALPDAQRIADRIARDVEWYRRNMVAAYESSGRHDAKWDEPALQALRAAAALWSDDPQRAGNEQETAWRASARAISAGCNDPLILYIHARMYHIAALESLDDAVRMYGEATTALDGSRYSPALRAMAHLRAAEAMIERARAKQLRPRGIAEEIDAARERLADVAAARDTPQVPVVELVGGILDASRQLGEDRSEDFEPIAATFAKAREPKDPLLPLLRARFLTDYAWDARGGKFANQVTETSHDVFQDRLQAAAREVTKAAAIDPTSPVLAPLMLGIELGQGHGRPRMESWFRYGVALDPGNFELYSAKLHYLEPRWYGSAEEMIEFGHEAMATKQWALRLPLVIIAAHHHLAHENEDPAEYYAGNAEACADIRAAMGGYLERYPEASYERSGYALLLYQCGDYRASNQQFQLLGSDGRIGPFLTRANYENKRVDAAARARSSR